MFEMELHCGNRSLNLNLVYFHDWSSKVQHYISFKCGSAMLIIGPWFMGNLRLKMTLSSMVGIGLAWVSMRGLDLDRINSPWLLPSTMNVAGEVFGYEVSWLMSKIPLLLTTTGTSSPSLLCVMSRMDVHPSVVRCSLSCLMSVGSIWKSEWETCCTWYSVE